MDTLFYDGRCPLCTREIRTLRRLQDGQLAFRDIHQLSDSELPAEMNREQLLRRLHALDSRGQWHRGLEATVLSWSHTRWGWLFRPLLWPPLRPLTKRLYRRWADRRYCNLYGCPVDTPH